MRISYVGQFRNNKNDPLSLAKINLRVPTDREETKFIIFRE